MWCDFHVHSNLSDGEFSPSRVVDIVADAGIGGMALTDHDTTGGIEEARRRAAARGVAFVTGIEMTTYAAGEVVHVLGLGMSPGDAGLARANAVAMDVWSDNQLRWVDALREEGFTLGGELVRDRPVRLPILIERLCRGGVDGGDPKKCYDRFKDFFAALPPQAYERLPSPAQAAAIIRSAGGIAVLAHPERLRERGRADLLLNDLDGIEALYGPYDAAARDALVSLAREHNKLYTCGSDYHGFFNGAYVNPQLEAPPALLVRLGL